MFGFSGSASEEGSSAPPAESRRHPRIESLGRAFAGVGNGKEASVLNVSLGGLLLRLTGTLTPGSSYFLKLFLNSEIAVVEALHTRQAEGPLGGTEQAE